LRHLFLLAKHLFVAALVVGIAPCLGGLKDEQSELFSSEF